MKIKIRAYDKKQKCFVKDLHNIRVRKNGEIYSQNRDIEINLFTGLFDKNNKEVYVNDIVISDSGNLYIIINELNTSGQFRLERVDDVVIAKYIPFHHYNIISKKVIGNIYEDKLMLLVRKHPLI